MVATLLGLFIAAAGAPGAGPDLSDGSLRGKVVRTGNFSAYIDAQKQFTVTTPRGWWFNDHFESSGGIWIGEPQVGGAAGRRTWDPQFTVIKYEAGKTSQHTTPWKRVYGKDGPEFLSAGRLGPIPYRVSHQLGWTYVEAYVNSPKAVWEIEVHIPKVGWRKSLPLALGIIESFKLH